MRMSASLILGLSLFLLVSTVARGQDQRSVLEQALRSLLGENVGKAVRPEIDLTPLPSVDQRLFLVHYLYDTYECWPDQPTSEWLVERRVLTSQLHKYIKRKELGGHLVEMYGDCLYRFESHQNYLEDIGAVKRGLLDQMKVERLANAGSISLGAGLDVGRHAMSGASLKGAVSSSVPGLVTGIAVGVIVEIFASAERDRQKKESLERFRSRYMRICDEIAKRSFENAGVLAETYGWKREEVGFDDFQSTSMDEYVARRPRDAFVLLKFAMTRDSATDNAVRFSIDAEHCLKVARLTPSDDPVLDVFRLDALRCASLLANNAIFSASRENGCHYPVPFAKRAIQIHSTRMTLEPADDKQGHYDLALARHYNGEHVYAAQTAIKVHEQMRDNPKYCYDVACMYSMAGDTANALLWLENGARYGENVSFSHIDPDLFPLRTTSRREFNESRNVSVGFEIKLGTIFDQVCATNNSKFRISNSLLKVVVEHGGRTWTKSLRVANLEPEETHTWNLGFREITVRDDNRTESIEVWCDQDPPIMPTVTEVIEGSVAQGAGIQVDDQFLFYGGSRLYAPRLRYDAETLASLVRKWHGREVQIVLLRNGRVMSLTVLVPINSPLGIGHKPRISSEQAAAEKWKSDEKWNSDERLRLIDQLKGSG